MKILHVCHNYFPSQGGSQYTMKNLSENLVSIYKDEVEVCTSNSFYAPEYNMFRLIEPAREMINHVQIFREKYRRWHYPLITFSRKISYKLTGNDLPYSIVQKRSQLDAPAIHKKMLQTNADVIMVTTAGYLFADYPSWRHKTKNLKPFVLYGAIHVDKGPVIPPVFMRRAMNADCYIANTFHEKERLVINGADASKIRVIGTGIEPADFIADTNQIILYRSNLGISGDDIVITFIGRIKSGKGVDTLLNAFEILLTKSISKKMYLLLAGTYTDHVELIRKRIEEKKLPVIIKHDFPEEEKKLMIHAADIFVLPSASESFGVVFLEAWACKKPVIGAATGAVSSVVSDGADGLLFKPSDEVDLAEKLSLLIANPGMRQTMGNNGYKKILEKYTWPVITKKFRDAYLFAIESFKEHAGRN